MTTYRSSGLRPCPPNCFGHVIPSQPRAPSFRLNSRLLFCQLLARSATGNPSRASRRKARTSWRRTSHSGGISPSRICIGVISLRLVKGWRQASQLEICEAVVSQSATFGVWGRTQGVLLNRIAGNGWHTPATSAKVFRAFSCGSLTASSKESTGSAQHSNVANSAAHVSRDC
ncbi:hypothetical protein D3C87_1572900 [compost metagenome]